MWGQELYRDVWKDGGETDRTELDNGWIEVMTWRCTSADSGIWWKLSSPGYFFIFIFLFIGQTYNLPCLRSSDGKLHSLTTFTQVWLPLATFKSSRKLSTDTVANLEKWVNCTPPYDQKQRHDQALHVLE